MKKIFLKLLRNYIKDDKFRINVCREIHYYHQNKFCEQTGYGRFYHACGDLFEAAPEFVLNDSFDTKGGVMSEFDQVKTYLKNKPRRNKLKRILK